MTFFLVMPWQPDPVTSGFCADIPDGADLGEIEFDDFHDHPPSPTERPRPLGRLSPTGEWTLEFRGHMEVEDSLKAFRASSGGILLKAASLKCDRKTRGASLRLSPLPGSGFYRVDLLPSGLWQGNKRYRSTCKNDADRCERIASVQISNNGKAKTFFSRDGACTVYIGRKGFATPIEVQSRAAR